MKSHHTCCDPDRKANPCESPSTNGWNLASKNKAHAVQLATTLLELGKSLPQSHFWTDADETMGRHAQKKI